MLRPGKIHGLDAIGDGGGAPARRGMETRMFYKDERLAVLIDGANVYAASRLLGFEVDFRLLREEFSRRGKLVRIGYYNSVTEGEEFTPLRPLLDWLDYNGFRVVTRPTREIVETTGRRRLKGNLEVHIAVDAMEIAERVDHMVLFAGDGDFRTLIAALQRRGVRVTVISTIRTQPAMVSDELRRQADAFVELAELQGLISRPVRDAGEGAMPDMARAPA